MRKAGKNLGWFVLAWWCVWLHAAGCVGGFPVSDASRRKLGASVQASATPQSEVSALEAIYNSTNGTDWIWTGTPWNFQQTNPEPCLQNWQGVRCQAQCNGVGECADQIVDLFLSRNNMSGSLPEVFSQLPALQVLNFTFNRRLTGALPTSLGNLTNLVSISLHNNALYGAIPPEYMALSGLTILRLGNNALGGTFSLGIGNLTSLQELSLGGNQFYGSLPTSLANLTQLSTLDLSMNDFMGSIPNLANLTALRLLDLHGNRLYGSLPISLCDLTTLAHLRVGNNQLRGTIPDCLAQLASLETLSLEANYLSGTLPDQWSELAQLVSFQAGNNLLHSSIPLELWQLPALRVLNVSANLLTSTFIQPADSQLSTLDAAYNFLSGPLPQTWGTQLGTLSLSHNLFTASIPAALCACTQLSTLHLDSNYLRGSIPSEIQNLTLLHDCVLSRNQLSGSFSFSFADAKALSTIEMQENLLTGPISFLPTTLNSSIQFINMSHNYLSGSMEVFSTLSNMSVGDISYNAITGPLVSLTYLHNIRVAFLQNNYLSGSMEGVLQGAFLPYLTYLDISGNRFSGELPVVALAQLPLFQVFAAAQNCFTGTMPAEICYCENLASIVLDGMSSAPGCRVRTLPFVPQVSSYLVRPSAIQGQIPSCLFSMPNLETLHMSGNGFDGSIPIYGTISPALVDLSLSHNLLTGTIPPSLLHGAQWTNLDLSFNRLSGELSYSKDDDSTGSGNITASTGFPSNASISLDNNRLSGRIPHEYYDLSQVNILRGNLFSCHSKANGEVHVPREDPFYEQYVCGSSQLDSSLFAWATTMAIIAAAFLVCAWGMRTYYRRGLEEWKSRSQVSSWAKSMLRMHTFTVQMLAWRSIFQSKDAIAFHFDPAHCQVPMEKLLYIYYAGVLLHKLRVFCLVVTLFLVFVASPVYISLSLFAGGDSYQFQYAWTNSATFLSGQDSAISLLVLFTILLLLVQWCSSSLQQSARRIFPTRLDCNRQARSAPSNSARPQLSFSSSTRFPSPEGEYDTAAREREATEDDQGSPPSLPHREPPIPKQAVEGAKEARERQNDFYKFVAWAIALVVLNTIVVLLVNGFYVYLQFEVSRLAAVVVAILVSIFKLVWGNTISYMSFQYLRPLLVPIIGTTFNGGSILFVSWLMLFNTIIAPCLAALIASSECFYYVFANPPTISTGYSYRACIQSDGHGGCGAFALAYDVLTFQPPFAYNYSCSSAGVTSYAFVYAYKYLLLGVLFPITVVAIVCFTNVKEEVDQGRWSAAAARRTTSLDVRTVLPPIWRETTLPAHAIRASHIEDYLSEQHWCYRLFGATDAVFSAENVALRIAMMLGALLTFGVIVPYLAILICCALWTNTYLAQLGLAKMLEATAKDASRRDVLEELCDQCKSLYRCVQLATRPIPYLILVIYCWVVFDVEGDGKGERWGWIFVVLMVALAGLTALTRRLFDAYHVRSLEREESLERDIPRVRFGHPSYSQDGGDIPLQKLFGSHDSTGSVQSPLHSTESTLPRPASMTLLIILSPPPPSPSSAGKSLASPSSS